MPRVEPPPSRERVIVFGPRSAPLIGVLAEPRAGAPARPAGPDVLLVAGGEAHRVGPQRRHVRAARAFADAGFASLRFDASGTGDSATRPGAPAFELRAALELGEAMEHLRSRRGIRRFVLMGSGPGADAALAAAAAEPDVVGVALLDPWVHPTWRFRMRRFAHRLMRVSGTPAHPPAQGDVEEVDRDPARRRKVTRDLARLTGRGVHVFCSLPLGVARRCNYRGQFGDAFPGVDFGNALWLEYREEVETAPGRGRPATDARDVEAVVSWLRRTHPVPAPDEGRGTGSAADATARPHRDRATVE